MSTLLPSKLKDFHKFSKQFMEVLEDILSNYDHIPADDHRDLRAKFEMFSTEFERTNSDSPRSQLVIRNEAKKTFEHALRRFIRNYIRNEKVSDAVLVQLGIHPIDHIRTPHIEVHEKVDALLHVRSKNAVNIDFWVCGSSHKAKPHGYKCHLAWTIADDEPKSLADFKYNTRMTKTEYKLSFDTYPEKVAGKTFWAVLAWENYRGNMGAWSDTFSTMLL